MKGPKKDRGWSPSVIGALLAAAILLSAGVLMAVYQEQLYSSQQIKSVREQAQVLAASAAAAILFDDHAAAQEYVDALRVNPELQGAAVYGADGRLLAGFARGARLPPMVTAAGTNFGDGYIDIAVPASQNGARAGTVMLRAITEAPERRNARYFGLILLVTMGALVIAVLSFAQAQLSRRASNWPTSICGCTRKWRSGARPRRRCARATRWKPSASFPAASPMTSTT